VLLHVSLQMVFVKVGSVAKIAKEAAVILAGEF
jgi:hypothetical protein